MNYRVVRIYKKYYAKVLREFPLIGKRWVFIRKPFPYLKYDFDTEIDVLNFIAAYHSGQVTKEIKIKEISL